MEFLMQQMQQGDHFLAKFIFYFWGQVLKTWKCSPREFWSRSVVATIAKTCPGSRFLCEFFSSCPSCPSTESIVANLQSHI